MPLVQASTKPVNKALAVTGVPSKKANSPRQATGEHEPVQGGLRAGTAGGNSCRSRKGRPAFAASGQGYDLMCVGERRIDLIADR